MMSTGPGSQMIELPENPLSSAEAIAERGQETRIDSRRDLPLADGWLALAAAQHKAGRRDEARKTIERVLEKKWEESLRVKEEKTLGADSVACGTEARIRLVTEAKVGTHVTEAEGRTWAQRSRAVTVSSSSRKRKDEHEWFRRWRL